MTCRVLFQEGDEENELLELATDSYGYGRGRMIVFLHCIHKIDRCSALDGQFWELEDRSREFRSERKYGTAAMTPGMAVLHK